MTFNDIAIKNFKAHSKRYLSYFLCSSFSITIFFIYSTIFFNQNLRNSNLVAQGVLETILIPTFAMIIFSVFFISYAHSAFVKSRQNEFGLFISLGMSTKHIAKIIFIENILIAIFSMSVGILTGMVFSRLFFFVILKVLNVSAIEFSLPYESFFVTLILFSIIFLIAIMISIIKTYRFQPIQLLKVSRVSETNKYFKNSFWIIGVLMMFGSIISLCLNFTEAKNIDSQSLILYITFCLIGLYITISQIGSLLIKVTKKRKKIYYKNLLFVTGLDYRFKQTKKIIFITTIMVLVTTFYCGSLFFFISSAENQAVKNNPYDISFIQLSNKNNISNNELNNIISTSNTSLKVHKTLEILKLTEIIYSKEYPGSRDIISVDKFNTLFNTNFHVDKGFYIHLDQNIGDKNNTLQPADQGVTDVAIKSSSGIINFKYTGTLSKYFFNGLQDESNIMIINDSDYADLISTTDVSNIENLHMLNFNDWHKTLEVVNRLNKEFTAYNLKTPKSSLATSLGISEKDYFKISSKIGDYLFAKQSSSVLLFLCGFLGLFFFIAASIILSFRLFTEIDQEKIKYKKLFKIGIRDKEITRILNNELGLIFFIPVILGSCLSLMYIYAFTSDGSSRTGPLTCTLITCLIYLIFQAVYYFVIRKIYFNKLMQF